MVFDRYYVSHLVDEKGLIYFNDDEWFYQHEREVVIFLRN